ncbi:MAG: hypothetical protein JSV41_06530 [Gemmatimonadota bacterium]|nr:MAG: hypothetical protein JSV41_06530 [Gemmatimonadota bacterium]
MAIECKTALELLLAAEPTELAGQGDSELAAHIRECKRCGAVAARLLAGQGELAGALGELGPRTDVEEALSVARARRRRIGWQRRGWRVAAPLAAAAAVAALFLARLPDGRMPGEMVLLPAPRIEPAVEAPLAQNVMVFETRDRSAKVIWFY